MCIINYKSSKYILIITKYTVYTVYTSIYRLLQNLECAKKPYLSGQNADFCSVLVVLPFQIKMFLDKCWNWKIGQHCLYLMKEWRRHPSEDKRRIIPVKGYKQRIILCWGGTEKWSTVSSIKLHDRILRNKGVPLESQISQKECILILWNNSHRSPISGLHALLGIEKQCT